MAEMAQGDDDDDDHSPSAGSATSLELYQSVRGMIPDGHVRDKDQISMKSDCATGMRRRLSILNTHEHKVRALIIRSVQMRVDGGKILAALRFFLFLKRLNVTNSVHRGIFKFPAFASVVARIMWGGAFPLYWRWVCGQVFPPQRKFFSCFQ